MQARIKLPFNFTIFWSLTCGATGNSAPTPSLTMNAALGVNSTVTNLGKKTQSHFEQKSLVWHIRD